MTSKNKLTRVFTDISQFPILVEILPSHIKVSNSIYVKEFQKKVKFFGN